MATLIVAAMLAGCASTPTHVVYVAWIKDGVYNVEKLDGACNIHTPADSVEFARFGALFKECLR